MEVVGTLGHVGVPKAGTTTRGVVVLASLLALGAAVALGPSAGAASASSSVPWIPMTAPTPAGAHNSGLVSVSCPTATAKLCVAVGYAFTALGGSNLAEVWKGGAWKISQTPDPGGASAADALESVSCGSPTYCMAVGGGDDGSFSELWNGSKWSVPSTSPGSATISISCFATQCLAVGFHLVNLTYTPSVAYWDGSAWANIPADGSLPQLLSVSCFAPGQCLVVGQSSTTVLGQLFENGTLTDVPGSDAGLTVSFRSVACQTANSPVTCMAEGFSQSSSGTHSPLTEIWNASTNAWSTTAPGTYSALSCPAAADCVAAGNMSLAGRDAIGAAAESWNGTAWTQMDTSRVNSNVLLKWLEFRAVSCPSPTFCVAVGDRSLKYAEAASWGTAP